MGIFGNILGNIVGSLLPFSQGGMIKSNLYTNKRKQKLRHKRIKPFKRTI